MRPHECRVQVIRYEERHRSGNPEWAGQRYAMLHWLPLAGALQEASCCFVLFPGSDIAVVLLPSKASCLLGISCRLAGFL
jgi:hypothetical protein